MSSALKIYALFIGSALLMFGGGLQGLLLSVRGEEEGFSLVALGLIGTGWSVGFVAGSIAVPLLVKRVGHIRAFSIMAAIGTITILLNLLWIQDIGWIVLRAFSGFCFAGAAMIVESWLNEVADNRSRGTIFSIYVTINMAASTIGQLAMSITGVQGHIPFVVGAISFICALLPTALTSTPQPRPIQSARLDVLLLYKTSPLAVIASFACGMANGTFGTLAPVYGVRQGLVPAEIGLLFAVTAIVGAVAQIPFGRLSDRMDRRMVIVFLSGMGAVIGLFTVLVNPAGWFMYALFGLYGFAAYPLYAIAVAHANDFAREGEFARVAGSMLLILGLGLAIGPLLASFLMQATGRPVDLFVVTAAFHGALAVTAFLRMRIRPVREGGRVRFRIMSAEKGVSPGTVPLDPRADEGQETIPQRAPKPPTPARPAETDVIVPDPVEPVVMTPDEPRPDAAGPEAPADGKADGTNEEQPATPEEKHVQD
ncbi:MAG TPA: MFS transporter [Alphaproteobacteria bacterium]|nr:MFS transporter [Alphaproteobacteria bacterium]